MKKIILAFLMVFLVNDAFAGCGYNDRRLANDIGRVEVCKWGGLFNWFLDWKGQDGWCPGYSVFNPGKHNAYKDEAGKCWKFKCNAGVLDFSDFNNCIPCSDVSQVVQNSICYTVPGCKITPDSGKVVLVIDGTPKCLNICDVQAAGSQFDTKDQTGLVFKILKQNAGTVGTRTGQ